VVHAKPREQTVVLSTGRAALARSVTWRSQVSKYMTKAPRTGVLAQALQSRQKQATIQLLVAPWTLQLVIWRRTQCDEGNELALAEHTCFYGDATLLWYRSS
jgi:hypothetical protein